MTEWKHWTPEYDGHAPDDWDGGIAQIKDFRDAWQNVNDRCFWGRGGLYRYRAKKPDLLAQCLALPQADREALIEALQKPVRDWADDVWDRALSAYHGHDAGDVEAAAVIRSMCRPREVELSDKFLYQRFADILEAYDMKNAAREIREGTCKDADLPEAIKALRNIIREALS